MADPVQCAYCNQAYVPDASAAGGLAACPHCGHENLMPGSRTQRLQLLRDAPTLVGSKSCPACGKSIERTADLCVHCGHDLATGKKVQGARASLGRRLWIPLAGAAGVLAAAVVFHAWVSRPAALSPPPEVAEPVAPPVEADVMPGPEPAPPPAAEAVVDPAEERAVFEARKSEAEQVFRRQLDETAPLYRLQDEVELRRKSGQILRGRLKFVGRGTNQIAIVVTESGKTIVPMKELDRDSRMRLDARYRENYIRYALKMPPGESGGRPAPAEKGAGGRP